MRTLEVDQLDEEIRDYQHRLDVDIMSYKEMESLREKILNQRRRMSELEDEALALMDRVEVERGETAAAEAAFVERKAELDQGLQEIEERTEAVRDEIEANAAAREAASGEIPGHLLRRYEELRRAHRDPVAEVRGGSCSGCNLRLSGSTVERVRGGQEIVSCEHCSRLLYVA
ncbi:MAG: hypothetical protein JSW65_07030, partial [Candidatus Bipolaricaulota bacterium]